MVDHFFTLSEKWIAETEKGFAENNAELVNEATHAIKGNIGNFPEAVAFEVATALNTCAREGDLAGAQNLWPSLKAEIVRLGEALRELNAKLES